MNDYSKEGIIEWIKAYIPRLNIRLIYKKPLLFYRLIKELIRAKITKKPKILGVDFSFTPCCNLKCEHCYTTAFGTQNNAIKKEYLSVNNMKKIIKKCVDAGIITYSFQGGEPLMSIDILETLIKSCNPNKSFIQIITNGVFGTESNLLRLKKAGLDGICVSIDSYNPEVHDHFRGVKGVFDKAMNCLEVAGKLGLTRSISTTVWKDTVKTPELESLFKYATDNKIGVQVFIGQPAGNWKNKKEVMLNEEEIKWLDEVYQKNKLIKRDLYNNFTYNGCPAFKTSIYITPKGEVLPCPFIHASFGNLLKNSFDNIVKRAHKFEFFRDFNAAPTCLSAENEEFIEKYLSKTFDENIELPLSYKQVFYDKEK